MKYLASVASSGAVFTISKMAGHPVPLLDLVITSVAFIASFLAAEAVDWLRS